MTQSIKISDELKNKIQQLQAQIFLQNGHKISLKDLLEKFLKLALANPTLLSQVMQQTQEKSVEDQWRKKFDIPKDWGITDSSSNIDRHIAGY
ncbi:MAG: hypothetical protein RBG13Loki_0020 [Promethearchaeota archaeon CR_4]|nr:MAG: hypothetical protein RBG13Loki_0020 [Candidatus Lokiarchaeota archaeon CR_4]